jgi:hypothetical protein
MKTACRRYPFCSRYYGFRHFNKRSSPVVVKAAAESASHCDSAALRRRLGFTHRRPRALWAKAREARVDTWLQSLLIGHPLEKRCQDISFLSVQCGQKRFLVLAGDAAYGLKQLLALRRELQGVGATVACILEPLDEPSTLQLVHEGDQPAREHAESFGDVLLTGSGGTGNEPKRAHVRWRQSERTKALGKLHGSVCPDLGEQKGRGRTFGTLVGRHRPRS